MTTYAQKHINVRGDFSASATIILLVHHISMVCELWLALDDEHDSEVEEVVSKLPCIPRAMAEASIAAAKAELEK